MDNNSAESVDPAMEIAAAGAPERRGVRRRLVQATLFPHKSPEMIESKGDLKSTNDDNNEECRDDEELCGSQGKKKRKQKTRTSPQKPRNPKKAKDKADATPKKNGASSDKIVKNSVDIENASPPTMPNLRLEAKLTAEMFAGKQIHPFFSSWKAGKKSLEATEGESNQCTLDRENRSTTIGPIHVFERIQDKAESINWGNWTFCERTFSDTSHHNEGMISSAFGSSFESLHFSKISSGSHVYGASSRQTKGCLDQCIIQLDHSRETSSTISTMLVGDPMDCQVDNDPCRAGDAGCLRKLDVEPQIGIHHERMTPYFLGCDNELGSSLWTVKYQPNKATEICGNNESVKFMSEWLHLWHGRDAQAIKDFTNTDKCNIKDNDYIYCESDPDSDYAHEEASLKNILLVTGPVGSGKSAAVYACAKEQGFKVFECNASECRNGALVKLKLGEVLESHCLPRSLKNPADSQSRLIVTSAQAQRNCKAVQECDVEIIELITTSDMENSHGDTETSETFFSKETRAASNLGALKPLILFEDVDITFSEDRGFITSVQQIAKKAKGPVILTSNSKNPVLPDNLDRLEVHFTMPSQKELLGHLSMISAAEKANIQPQSMEQLLECCQGDIRKAIMHLQFWCQGRGFRKDKKVQKECDSLVFDLEVGHWLLPKIVPWDLPSQLSELVEQEISMSLHVMEKNSTLMELVKEELGNEEMQNGWEMHDDEIEAKKEAMLSRNGCVQTCDEFGAAFASGCDFSSPFSERKSRRKLAIVTSSDSEDELLNNGVPSATDKDANNKLYLDEDSRLLSHCPNSQHCTNPLADKLCSEVKKFEDNSCKYSEIAHDLQSVDMLCVPESSFVPETEIDNGAEVLSGIMSCGPVAETVEASVSNEFIQNLSLVATNSHDISTLVLHKSDLLGSALDVIAKSCTGEDVGNSQNEHVNAFTRGYQVMDECSRMDFNRWSKPIEEHGSWIATNLVQESWKKLRGSLTDLKQYVTSEEKKGFQVLKLALGMSNVISEADLMLCKCQALDFLELSTARSEESEVFSRCDEQLQMTSTIAEHGFSFYVKDIPATNWDINCERRINLTEEMLAKLVSTANMVTFGKLIGQDERACTSSNAGDGSQINPPESEVSLKSKMNSGVFDTIKSIVPSRSLLALKGIARHEYLSSLSCMSRSEASRISEGSKKTRKRRGRVARHYLSTLMSPEDISLLDQYHLPRTCSLESEDATFT